MRRLPLQPCLAARSWKLMHAPRNGGGAFGVFQGVAPKRGLEYLADGGKYLVPAEPTQIAEALRGWWESQHPAAAAARGG